MFSAATKSGAPATAANYIEDVFSTYLYTGTGATQTITNGINLSGKGGLVWIKDRTNAYNHNLFDTVQGATKLLHSNTTDLQTTDANSLTAFTASGFTLGSGNTAGNQVNTSADNFVSWTFRKQAKFFDVVTYTGTGTVQNIAHNLGSTPGCIMIKRLTTSANNWRVYHRSLASGDILQLNLTNASSSSPGSFNSTAPTSTVFTVGTDVATNASGNTYVAYLFAHNAGGFGLTGTDNVISCGSYTTNSSGVITSPVNLGYEPQWILYKRIDASRDWGIVDSMRGNPVADGTQKYLYSNLSDAEIGSYGEPSPTSTGFTVTVSTANSTYIYIAIRRGPMKTPTSGTSVFTPVTRTGTGATATVSSPNFPVDLAVIRNRPDIQDNKFADRLRGKTLALVSNSTAAEGTDTQGLLGFDLQNGITVGTDSAYNKSATAMANWLFRRAPGFFDVVCYTGDGTGGSGRAITHNLGVAPELVIVKSRSNAYDWRVWQTSFSTVYNILLNSSAAQNANFYLWANTYLAVTNPTTQFGVYGDGTTNSTNTSGATYVAYLFATVAGVSKVGSYSGTGATQTINCGFTGGARFVLIKRTDSTGDWYVWDTARGMVSGTDPSLLLNSTAAEVNANSVYTTAGGFQIVSTAAGINASGGSYIFFAVA